MILDGVRFFFIARRKKQQHRRKIRGDLADEFAFSPRKSFRSIGFDNHENHAERRFSVFRS